MIYQHYKGGFYTLIGSVIGVSKPCKDARFFCEARLESDGTDGQIYMVYLDANGFCIPDLDNDIARSLYQSIKDGKIWIRPSSEFFDGRFEPVD